MRWSCLALVVLLSSSFGGCISVLAQETPPAPALHEALLWSQTYPAVVVEVAAVKGYEPQPATLVALNEALREVAGKARVAFSGPVLLDPQGGGYTEQSLVDLHRSTATLIDPGERAQGKTATLHVLFLDGRLAGSNDARSVLGTTLAAQGLIAVFPDEYRGAYRLSGDGTQRNAVPEIERHVVLHELGHAFGLVGQRIPMVRDHLDPGHVGHSSNPLSLMHHLPPMTPARVVYGPSELDYDVDDRADILAFQARDPGLLGR